jgi:hypothetical protein
VANRPHRFLCRQHSSPHCDTFSNGRLKFKRPFETPVGRNQGIFVISTALPPPSSAQSTSRHPGGVGECGARWVNMEGAFRTPGILTREHLSSGVASAARSAVHRQAFALCRCGKGCSQPSSRSPASAGERGKGLYGSRLPPRGRRVQCAANDHASRLNTDRAAPPDTPPPGQEPKLRQQLRTPSA